MKCFFFISAFFLFSFSTFAEIKIVTANMARMLDRTKLKQLAKNLKIKNADFYLMQEVRFRTSQDHSAADVAKVLGFHHFAIKRGQDDEGLGILSRYPILASKAIHHKAKDLYDRVSLYIKVHHPDLGEISVLNTHLAYRSHVAHIRKAQLNELLAWYDLFPGDLKTAMTFVGGDFNADFSKSEVQDFINTFPLKSFNNLSQVSYVGSNPGQRIDFIFVSDEQGRLNFLDESILFKNSKLPSGEVVSDHLFVQHRYDY